MSEQQRRPRSSTRSRKESPTGRGGAGLRAWVVLAGALALGGVARADEPQESIPSLTPQSLETDKTVFAALALPAKTPRDALRKLELAARSGDPERAVPLFAEPFGTALRKTFAAGHLLLDATRRLDGAITTKLGPEAARLLGLEKRLRGSSRLPGETAVEIVSVSETKEGATAVVKARSRGPRAKEETVELVKQDGEWKLLPPKRDGKTFGEQDLTQMDLLAKGLENAAAVLVKLANDVENGTVNTVATCRQQIEAADLEILKATIGLNPPSEDDVTPSSSR